MALDEVAIDRLQYLLVEYDEEGQLFGTSGVGSMAGSLFLAEFLVKHGVRPREEGCDCAELCSMGPTCPGGSLAGLPGSGCWRTRVTPPGEGRTSDAGDDLAVSHWTSWPPMDDGPILTDEEQMALVTAVRVQQVARIITRDTGADEDAALTAAWSLAKVGLLATPWRGETNVIPPARGGQNDA